MGAAEHGADFPMAKKLRQTMTHQQLHDFAVGPMTNKPNYVNKITQPAPDTSMPVPSTRVPMESLDPDHGQMHTMTPASPTPQPMASPAPPPASHIQSFLSGNTPGIVGSNTSSLKNSGLTELEATRRAIGMASKPSNRHKNLGKFLHPRKDGKAHGSGY